MGTLSIWHWLVLLVIVVLIFGTKKLRGAGSDLGSAVRNFKEGMRAEETKGSEIKSELPPEAGHTYDAEAKKEASRT